MKLKFSSLFDIAEGLINGITMAIHSSMLEHFHFVVLDCAELSTFHFRISSSGCYFPLKLLLDFSALDCQL